MLTTDAVGGVWTYSLELAAALAEQADTMTFLAVLGPSPNAGQLSRAAAIPGLQLVETGLPLDWTAADEATLRTTGTALAELAARADADLVQLHAPALAAADFPAPVVTVVHSCVATWWAAMREESLPDDFAWRTALAREGLRHSDLLVAPTRAFAAAVRQAYGLAQAPLAVPNGRTAAVAAAPSDGACFCLTAGRLWDEGKNVTAFDAAAALSATPFRAAGPLVGPNGAMVQLSAAASLGLIPEDRLAELLAERPIFVSPSRYEPFGLSVLEAAQAGCPLVLSSIPTFHELWTDAALFADSPHEIAAAVDRLAADPVERRRLGESARRRAARFTPEATGHAMLGHYRDLLGRERKVAA
ncbi:glycosyltransferase family 4 protein [Sphingomonas sp. BN140010]|uniref:Glycosyltransferase family 4 protein n=1 Tax=Sphingomonas arvum TaxID=2992113 RepID=A0ABT3JBY6_9SPHN|nr:glycosyltransferase family 4 protein [Sphingomonas sp. BN140010]MCW3796583.1 glycosyltransferase family 4 protein [Sphingomonas sp. BN140010]